MKLLYIQNRRTYFESGKTHWFTAGLLNYVNEFSTKFIVARSRNFHKMQQEAPDKNFAAAPATEAIVTVVNAPI